MNNLDNRNYGELEKAIALAQHTVYKRYLPELEYYPVISPSQSLLDEEAKDCIRLLQLEELSCKKGEDIFQKLSTVYYASMSMGCNLVIMIDVESINSPAKIYIGVRNSGYGEELKKSLGTSFRTLKNGLDSNFPGTKLKEVPTQNELPKLISDVFGEHAKHISSVSCVASIRDKSKTEHKTFIQGIERFIDAMRGNAYTALFIAEPSSVSELATTRSGYEDMYSTLSSFSKSQWSYNENQSMAVLESLSDGISNSISKGVTDTQSHSTTKGWNAGVNLGGGISKSTGVSSVSKGKLMAVGVLGVAAGGALILASGGAATPLVASVASALTNTGGALAAANQAVTTITKALSGSAGINAGISRSKTDGTAHSDTNTNTKTSSQDRTTGTTKTSGTGKTIQIETLNKPIIEILSKVDEQLVRIKEGEDYGAFCCGAYFLSGKQDSSLLAANTYRSLMIGEGSSVESGAINSWSALEEPDKVNAIKGYLSRFTNPVFAMPINEEVTSTDDIVTYTTGTMVSGLELPLHLGLPSKSVYGLPVTEHAEFGRNVTIKQTFDVEDNRKIKIGNIFHMGQVEAKSEVNVDVSELTAHTFITGSTGSGKSNTIYKMLEKLGENNTKFLVIEPAKGEYRLKFGNRADVTVYGTNNKISGLEMLRINPFSFPSNVHVLEHLDRLVEIFNVCWPMYAAMPAILKDSIQRAYEIAGWDIETSENKFDNRIFPTFNDVYSQIKLVLNESDYSADNKGDYTGALVTRLKSLTNGINGLIFTPDEVSLSDLFDKNVIIDLSRVGSSETKALIMGLLVLKLQEYRMDSAKLDQKLKHVTVLEEAHNLLRRTSTEQSTENSNLMGKSVEMLANAIAEMRTYGEGFIIADQSPGLLDMSVIRNTNTKIILRLPDYNDRKLVGLAAALNEEQILELAKLDNGVCAIKQSKWLEPVLCKVDKFEGDNKDLKNNKKIENIKTPVDTKKLSKQLLKCIMNNELYRKGDRVDIKKLKNDIIMSRLDAKVKYEFFDYINANSNSNEANLSFRKLAFEFFNAEEAIKDASGYDDIVTWSKAVVDKLNPSVNEYTNAQMNLLMGILAQEIADRDRNYNDLYVRYTELFKAEGRVF